MTTDVIQLSFDYADLAAPVAATVRHHTTVLRDDLRRLDGLVKQTAQTIWEIGQRLAQVQAELAPSGLFAAWYASEFPTKGKSTLYNALNVFRQFPTLPTEEQGEIGLKALYLLAQPSTPEAARVEVIERVQAGEAISHTTAKAIVAEHKAPSIDEQIRLALAAGPHRQMEALKLIASLDVAAQSTSFWTHDKDACVNADTAMRNRDTTRTWCEIQRIKDRGLRTMLEQSYAGAARELGLVWPPLPNLPSDLVDWKLFRNEEDGALWAQHKSGVKYRRDMSPAGTDESLWLRCRATEAALRYLTSNGWQDIHFAVDSQRWMTHKLSMVVAGVTLDDLANVADEADTARLAVARSRPAPAPVGIEADEELTSYEAAIIEGQGAEAENAPTPLTPATHAELTRLGCTVGAWRDDGVEEYCITLPDGTEEWMSHRRIGAVVSGRETLVVTSVEIQTLVRNALEFLALTHPKAVGLLAELVITGPRNDENDSSAVRLARFCGVQHGYSVANFHEPYWAQSIATVEKILRGSKEGLR